MIHDLKPYHAMKDSGVPWLGEVPEHRGLQRTADPGSGYFLLLPRRTCLSFACLSRPPTAMDVATGGMTSS